MSVAHKMQITVLSTIYSGVGLALAKGLSLIDWHSIAEAGIKSAVWTLSGLAVTYVFNKVMAKHKKNDN